jgi:hypothetical protein
LGEKEFVDILLMPKQFSEKSLENSQPWHLNKVLVA